MGQHHITGNLTPMAGGNRAIIIYIFTNYNTTSKIPGMFASFKLVFCTYATSHKNTTASNLDEPTLLASDSVEETLTYYTVTIWVNTVQLFNERGMKCLEKA